MTSIIHGKYLTYFNIGNRTFRDNLKFFRHGENLRIERIQRRYDTFFKRFTKYERNTLTFEYLDEENKQVGGKLKVSTQEFNFSLMRNLNYYQYGYFTNDRLVFAKFNLEEDLSLDGKKLEEIISDNLESTDIVLRHNYQIIGNQFMYKVEVNPRLADKYHEDVTGSTNSSELLPLYPKTLTEKFFYTFN